MDAALIGLKKSLPKVSIKQPLREVRRSISKSRLNGLSFLDERTSVAIWEIGNCIIIADEQVDGLTDVELKNYQLTPPNNDACKGWNDLATRWVNFGWLDRVVSCEVAEEPPDIITKALQYLEDSERYRTNWAYDASVRYSAVPDSDTMKEEWGKHLNELQKYLEQARQVQVARQLASKKSAKEAAEEYWAILQGSWIASGGDSIPQESSPSAHIHGDLVEGNKTVYGSQYTVQGNLNKSGDGVPPTNEAPISNDSNTNNEPPR